MIFDLELMEMETNHPVGYVVNNLPYIIQNKRSGQPAHKNDVPYRMVVLCFRTPAEILTREGLQTCAPGDCLIVAPTFPEYHTNAPGQTEGFVNDWMHLRVVDLRAFELLDVPVNTLIHTGDSTFLRGDMYAIRDELLYRRDLYEQMVSSILERMFIRLKRAYWEVESPRSSSVYHERLLELRQRVMESIGDSWSVAQMATALSLSASRFTIVYRGQFNVSPLEDLIQMRVTAAKKMLLSTDSSLREIAGRCGFGNEYYFSRIFKNKTGVAPSTYRRK